MRIPVSVDLRAYCHDTKRNDMLEKRDTYWRCFNVEKPNSSSLGKRANSAPFCNARWRILQTDLRQVGSQTWHKVASRVFEHGGISFCLCHPDIDRYLRVAQLPKPGLLPSDVFRPPSHPLLFASLLGSSVQLLCLVVELLILAGERPSFCRA